MKLDRSNINVILNAEVYEDFREENMENFLFYFHSELDQINYQLNDEKYRNFFKKFQTDKNKQKIGENDNNIWNFFKTSVIANSENGKHCEEKDVNDDEYDEKYFNDEHEEEEDNFYGDDNHLIIKRTPLQFAYAGESKEILQLLLGQSNIKDEKTNKNDILIKKFTKCINTNPSNNNDMSTDE